MWRIARRPGVLLTAVLLVAGAIVALVLTRGPEVETAPAVRRDLEQHLVASGRVWVPTRVQVAAQVAGLVVAVPVVEGQRVAVGDTLVQLDDAEARAAVAQANANAAAAAARVEQLRKVGRIVATETLRQAETRLARAETELTRVEALAASGSLPRAQLDDARRDVDLARAARKAAEVQELSSAPMGADERVSLSALLEARASLTAATVRLEQTRIVARHAGVILVRDVEPGDVVPPSRVLLVMAADAGTQLVIEPDERNLAWLHVGQHARASADAFPREPFDAEVSYVAPSVDPQRGSIEVRLRVASPPAFLKPDMTVSVDLTVATRSAIVVVPSEAIRGASTPSPSVLVVEHGRIEKRDVEIGIRGAGSTEIVKGIGEGTAVVVSTKQALVPGQRVRAVKGGP